MITRMKKPSPARRSTVPNQRIRPGVEAAAWPQRDEDGGGFRKPSPANVQVGQRESKDPKKPLSRASSMETLESEISQLREENAKLRK